MNKILWIDLEMSGLNVETEVIIEVAAIVTDLKFNELDQFHSVIKQDQKYIDSMDDWNKKHHGQSGLIDKIPHAPSPQSVEQSLIEFVTKNFRRSEPVILAGNSIHQDRLFLAKYFKEFTQKLHYRMLDTTAWKLILENIYGVQFHKNNSHQALEDIKESISEMKHYLKYIKIDPIIKSNKVIK